MLQIDPKAVNLIVGGNIITGYSDGTWLNIERNEDMWALKVGVDGIGTRIKTNNRSGRVTITLLQSSPSNDVLSALAVSDETGNVGAVPFLMRDGLGRTVATALTAWVVKLPAVSYGKDVAERAWMIESDALTVFIGGN